MVRVYVMPTIVPPSGQITVYVEGYDGNEGTKNVQVGFSRVELQREIASISAGIVTHTAEQFQVTMTLPDGIPSGPYLLTELRLLPMSADDESSQLHGDEVNLLVGEPVLRDLAVFFGDAQTRSAAEEIQDLHAERRNRIQTRIEVEVVPSSQRLRVAYLYSGLLVHGPQHCEGYSLLPYAPGLMPTSIFVAVNQFSLEFFGVTFPLEQQQVNEYSSQQPLAAVLFHNVGATTASRAMHGTRPRADVIALALAFERGRVPEPFGCVIENGNDLNMWLLHRPYQGNLLPSFGHTDQGAEVERLTAAMTNSPFSKLLLELYVQAISEEDPNFMVFRFWAILELLAKRAIPESSYHIFDAHGERIRGSNGQLITTSKAEAKVYKYVFDQGICGSYGNYTTSDGPFTLIVEGASVAPPLEGQGLQIAYWDFILAVYAIRNAVAHEGRFLLEQDVDVAEPTGLATMLLTLNHDGVIRQIRNTTKLAVLRELHRLSGFVVTDSDR